MKPSRPIIGITADISSGGAEKFLVGRSYIAMVEQAGGVPVILPCLTSCVNEYIQCCDGIMFTGGDDPITTHPRMGGLPMHPKATPIDPQRQEFELALLDALHIDQSKPALGICLGMQMMGLHAGGKIDQQLPDTLASADQHWDRRAHDITGELGSGVVHSHHQQALTNAGNMRVIATALDGVIEAIRRDDRPFFVGVQWHPERTDDAALGVGLIRQLVEAAKNNR